MTLLAMLRHGETAWNLARRIQGRTDIPLSPEGRTRIRACSLPEAFTGWRTACSPLARCKETAGLLGLHDVEVEPRLTEMSWGNWEGRTLDELRSEFAGEMRANEDLGLDFAPPGGESPRQVFTRVSDWLAETARRGESTLAVSHKGVIRAVFAVAMGWDMRGRPPVRMNWSALQVFNLDAHGVPGPYRLNVALNVSEGARH